MWGTLGQDLISYLLKTCVCCTAKHCPGNVHAPIWNISIYQRETELSQAMKQCDTVNRLNRKITYKTPPHRSLTTRQCLLQSQDWPRGILMPGKCSLRAGTSVLVYCGHLKAVWSLQSYFGGLGGGEISAFSCAGCFHYTPPTNSVWHRLDKHQGHRHLPSQYGHLLSVK